LTEDLHEANKTIHSNRQLLKEYQNRSKDHTNHLSELQNELDVSVNRFQMKEQELSQQKYKQEATKRFLANEQDWLLRERTLIDQLEVERQERLKLQSERASALSRLEESLKQKECDHHVDYQKLLSEIQAMRSDILQYRQCQPGDSSRQVSLTPTATRHMKPNQKDTSVVHEVLAGEQKVKEGCSQVDHSSGLVGQHVCVHSEDQSSAGFSQDSSTVWSEDELKYELSALRQELSESEAERLHLSRQCDTYADLCDRQKLQCDDTALEVQKYKASLHALESERDKALGHCQKLENLLRKVQDQLKARHEHCENLQKSVDDLQLREAKKHQLSEEFEQLAKRFQEQNLHLAEQSNQISLLQEEVLCKSSQLKSVNKQARETIKRLRAQCKKQDEELIRLRKENSHMTSHTNRSDQGFMSECDYLELKVKIAEIKSSLTQCEMEKTHVEVQLGSTQSALNEKYAEVDKLHTDLAVSQDRLKELSLENVQLKESIQTGLQKLSSEKELQAEIQDSAHRHSQQIARAKLKISHAQAENSALKDEVSHLLQVNQSLTSQLSTPTTNPTSKVKKAKDHAKTQNIPKDGVAQTKRRFDESIQLLKECHKQELRDIQKQHASELEQLQETVAELQVQLEDKESVLRALRRQQIKTFTDQQRIGDDLSKSLEDTEKLRRKYFAARKYYEDKLNTIEREAAQSDVLLSSKLQVDLRDTQRNMSQLVADYKMVLDTVQEEIDAVVSKFGHFDEAVSLSKALSSSILTGYEDDYPNEDLKEWIAITMAKLKWIQRQVDLSTTSSATQSWRQ
jgi:hypothetical protein